MSAPRLAIIADDLTGAADSAARCSHAGLSAEIWLPVAAPPSSVPSTGVPSTGVDVVALSTDSRFLPAEEAKARVAATLNELAAWTHVTWYKKIDSTLRGNLGAELDAMLDLLARREGQPAYAVVICPAFPAQARGLEGGTLVYAGAPPRHLPTLLREQSQLPVGKVTLSTVRQGRDTLAAALVQLRDQGSRLLVVDALTEADLGTIVAAAAAPSFLLCGSAGMVAPLAARWARPATREPTLTPVDDGPILALVGSGSATAHAQVAQVAHAQTMRVRCLDNDWYEMDLVGAQSRPQGDWLVHLQQPAANTLLEGPLARAQAARLADVAFAAVEKLQPSTLLVVGGDTAYFVLRRLGIARLAVREELLPGIALTEGMDRSGQRRAVILKPGNFGDAQTLLTLQNAVRRRQNAVRRQAG